VSSDPPQACDAYLHDSAPDWAAIDFDLLCSRCGYNLRLLPTPRCPECGLEFDWRALLAARYSASDFLFEYRWRDRPLRAWFKTMVRALRPWRFWRAVSLHERICPGPLVVMLLASPVVFAIVLHGFALLLAVACHYLDELLGQFGWGTSSTNLDIAVGVLGSIAYLPREAGIEYAIFPCAVLLALIGAGGMICVLRNTRGQRRIRRVQVLRVLAYSATPACVVGALLMPLLAAILAISMPQTFAVAILASLTMFVGPPLLLGSFLAVGLRRYLLIPRPWIVGLAAALVGHLSAWAIIMLVLLAFIMV